MKTIIAGSRDIDEWELVFDLIKSTDLNIKTVVCGMASGIDMTGYYYALDYNLSLECYFPNWKVHGKAAGPVRNSAMVDASDSAIYIIKDYSKGSMDCLKKAKSRLLDYVCFHITEKDGYYELVEIETSDGIKGPDTGYFGRVQRIFSDYRERKKTENTSVSSRKSPAVAR